MFALIERRGDRPGQRHELLGEIIVIGRQSGSTIQLRDERVSRQHLELRATSSGHRLRDLGSGNGTLVNGVPVTECDLTPGDEITVGSTVFVYTAGEVSPFRSRIRRSVPEAIGSRILSGDDPDWLRVRLANLGVLYEAAAAVSQILDIDALLDRLLALVIKATGAEHGGVLLADGESGELMPRPAGFSFSRTIVEHVRREREGILIGDAAADRRFAGGESIVRHGLREVIAVPMRGRHDSIGVLVLDGVCGFTPDHLHLAVAVAHQAALAVEETRYYRSLLNAERLAAVGQTIAGMSHHIKNVMQGVRFGGDMIRTGLQSDDKQLIAQGWSLVEKNQARIDALILDMLSFSKERVPLKQPTNLAGIIRDVLEVVRGRALEQKIAIDCTLAENAPNVDCDSHALHAAILNVVTNAIDALEGGPDPRASIKLTITETQAVIIVEDNGTGIPEDQREAIFQPFLSTKGSRGTGLGLPVSRKILREHGGDLVVEDAPGGGARFVMTLPRESNACTEQ